MDTAHTIARRRAWSAVLAILIAAATLVAVQTVRAPHAIADSPGYVDSSERGTTMCLQAHACVDTFQLTQLEIGTGTAATVKADITTAASHANSQDVIRLQVDGYSLTQAQTTVFRSTVSVNNGGHGTAISHPAGPVTLSTACATLTPHFNISARLRDGSVQRFTVDGDAFAPFEGDNDCPTYGASNFDTNHELCVTPGNHDCIYDDMQLMVSAEHKIYGFAREGVPDSRSGNAFHYQRLVRANSTTSNCLRATPS